MPEAPITEHDPGAFSDAEIEAAHRLADLLYREVFPHDPPSSVDQAIAVHRSSPPWVTRRSWHAWSAEGALIGVASTQIDHDHDDNPDVLSVHLGVHPDHRRRGIGTRLLR